MGYKFYKTEVFKKLFKFHYLISMKHISIKQLVILKQQIHVKLSTKD